MKIINLCPSCAHGDCYGHKAEYLNAEHRVTICRCPDPNHHHGKLKRKELGE